MQVRKRDFLFHQDDKVSFFFETLNSIFASYFTLSLSNIPFINYPSFPFFIKLFHRLLVGSIIISTNLEVYFKHNV